MAPSTNLGPFHHGPTGRRRGRPGRLDRAERILQGLNPEQRAAAETTRGPLCILAGAGTGKTTTITRRIAWQVATGAFPPQQIVAVTFTGKAAGELRSRLAALGVEGVRASTFHSAALALLRNFQGDPGRILSSKAILLRRSATGCRARTASGPPAILRPRSSGRRTGGSTSEDGTATGSATTSRRFRLDLMHRVFREVRTAEERRRSCFSTSRRPARADGAGLLSTGATRRAAASAAIVGEPPPSTKCQDVGPPAAVAVLVTSGSASGDDLLRGRRRRLQGDLRLHRRERAVAASTARRFPRAHVVKLGRSYRSDAVRMHRARRSGSSRASARLGEGARPGNS